MPSRGVCDFLAKLSRVVVLLKSKYREDGVCTSELN